MGPVARQVDDNQGIQSILCCALHHYLIQVIPTVVDDDLVPGMVKDLSLRPIHSNQVGSLLNQSAQACF